MKLPKLLENRFTSYLEWEEPWPALDSEGGPVDAVVTLKATVHDCIAMQRIQMLAKTNSSSYLDIQLLDDFIVVNWAVEIR